MTRDLTAREIGRIRRWTGSSPASIRRAMLGLSFPRVYDRVAWAIRLMGLDAEMAPLRTKRLTPAATDATGPRIRGRRDQSVADRFWAHVDCSDASGACWPWRGGVVTGGYGRFRVGKKLWVSHRYAFALAFGDIPTGSVVMHKCDVPACCNPRHLELGSQLENVRDAMTKHRRARSASFSNGGAHA